MSPVFSAVSLVAFTPWKASEFYVGPRHAMQIIGMDICTKGVGEGQNLHPYHLDPGSIA